MPKRTKHQIIWSRIKDGNHDDLELQIPKIINTDIGFQLMFGIQPDIGEDDLKTKLHHLNYKKDIKELDYESIKKWYK